MRLLRNMILLVIGLALVAGVVAWTCPADIAYRLFGDRLGPLKLSEISGSIWHGHAGSTRVFGRELGALDWQLEPLSVLQREPRAQLALVGVDTQARGEVMRNTAGQVDIRNASVNLPASVIEPAIGVPDLHLLGRIDITLTQARLRGAWIESADGNALWRDAAVSGAAQARLSDLRATFVTMPDGGISGELRDLGGPLLADGLFKAAAGNYEAELKLATRDGDPHVLEALQFVGQPQQDGSVLLKIRGHLLQVF